jgi:hypothetical protein
VTVNVSTVGLDSADANLARSMRRAARRKVVAMEPPLRLRSACSGRSTAGLPSLYSAGGVGNLGCNGRHPVSSM